MFRFAPSRRCPFRAVPIPLAFVSLLLFGVLFGLPSFAQSPSEPQAPSQPVQPQPEPPAYNGPPPAAIRVSTDLVLLDATVKTKKGQIIGGLKQGDFVVREDGVAQKIQVFGRDTLPLNLVILLDTSASTGHFLEPLRLASTKSLAALKPEDQVALMSFSDEALLRIPFTSDKPVVAAELITFRTGGETNINDALYAAAQYMRNEAPNGRRVIILISDDLATDAGRYITEEIVNQTLAADVAVYNLKLPDLNTALDELTARKIFGKVDLPRVLQQSGGELFDVPKIENMTTVFGNLIDRIKSRYTLGYYVSAEEPSGKRHKLTVSLAPSFGKEGRNYVILAKSGYVSP